MSQSQLRQAPASVPQDTTGEAATPPQLSIVAPVHNEEESLESFLADVSSAFSASGMSFELIAVDDGSTDGSLGLLRSQRRRYPWLRVLRMTRRPALVADGKGPAYLAGFRYSRGALVATIDADGQNDPEDLIRMVERLHKEGVDLVQGDRTQGRKDSWIRLATSRVGRWFRRRVIGDTIRDTACGARVLRREVALALPLQYRGLHRFMGYYASLIGYRVIEVPTHHLPRAAGRSKYGIGNRALPGLADLLALRWMGKTLLPTDCEEMGPTPRSSTT